MSKFMSFLENIDNDIINETYVDDTVVEEVEAKPAPKKAVRKKPATTKKDSSVKLIEARIRTKLDDIGLNESAISEVVSFVLNDVQKVNEVTSSTDQQPKPKKKQVSESKAPTSIMGQAENLLAGLPDTPTMGPLPTRGGGDEVVAESDLSGVASHASSLL